jgi:hypothetical protein
MRILAVVAESELQGIECGAITAHRFQKDTWVLFVDFPRSFRVLAYQSSGLPHGSHTRLQSVPYTAAMEVLS